MRILYYTFLVFFLGLLMGMWLYRKLFSSRPKKVGLDEYERLYSAGMRSLGMGDFNRAVASLTSAAKHRTKSFELFLLLGDIYREKGEPEKAIKIHTPLRFRSDLTESQKVMVLNSLGRDYSFAGINDRAIRSYMEALEIDDKNRDSLKELLDLYEKEKKLERAIEICQRLMKVDPGIEDIKLAHLYTEFGIEKFFDGNLDEALKLFRKALSIDEDIPAARLNTGDIHFRMGKHEKAMEEWESLLEKYSGYRPIILERLKEALDALSEPTRIEKICLKLLRGNSDDWQTRLFLSEHYLMGNQMDIAKRYCKEAFMINPHSRSVQKQLLKLLSGESQEARAFTKDLKIWEPPLFTDPYLCKECRFQSNDFLWKCPQCGSWESFRL
ncbi:MAG: tetratricopeptide repeat protein [Acidobacteriota bacterium]